MIHWLSDLKPRAHTRRLDIVDAHVLDARSRWPAPQGALEAFDGLRLTLRHRFHRAVVVVGDVAVQAFAPGRVEGEVAIAHTLDAAAHEKSSRDTHRRVNPVAFAASLPARAPASPSDPPPPAVPASAPR